ncbi:MAG: hypothetical protein N3A38_04680 [Planctomycetota bacterium]|nr:hypothetical protein [Planctomycetota bacterium]
MAARTGRKTGAGDGGAKGAKPRRGSGGIYAPGAGSRQFISGIASNLNIGCELGPPRTECAPGALFGWADRLWVVAYVSSKAKSGVGCGLYEITPDLELIKRPESLVGTYTNRMAHYESNQLFIGPYAIDSQRKVRVIEELADVRLCSTMRHLEDPAGKVYMLGMEGEFFELDVGTLRARRLFDLCSELSIPKDRWPHFKAGYSAFGRVVVASNTYEHRDYEGEECAGRLAEWDGKEWRILEKAPFCEVTGLADFSKTMFATGWDKASAILKVYTSRDAQWRTYRLPMASHCFDHGWSTEWPRIRQTEHERYLMDCHGTFFELCPWAYRNRIWGVRPISTHLWVLGDFCSWRGYLVLGADNASAIGARNTLCGEPQSGLWFGKTDDLWSFGKPSGWGGPWRETDVRAGEPSDPYLMTGYEHKVLHLVNDSSEQVNFDVQADFLGDDSRWVSYAKLRVDGGGYLHHEFPAGFSAHWVRLVADRDCRATAWFTYT